MEEGGSRHVVFGAGPLGLAVARALVARGRTARLVARRSPADAPAGVEFMAADLRDPREVARVTDGASVAYQCAQPPYHRWPEEFPSLQAAILEGTAAAAAKLVVAENLYMYGEVEGPLTEDLPFAARTRKGRTRARMAEDLLAAHRAGRVRVVMGRGSDFFGPGVRQSALGERVFGPAVAGGKASAAGRLDVPHAYTFIDDFGRALVTLGDRDEAFGRAWHVPCLPPLTQREIIAMIFEEAGHAPRMSGTGALAMRIAGLFIPGARETVEMMYEFDRPFVVDWSAYERTFGEAATPPREAIRATVVWYRARGR